MPEVGFRYISYNEGMPEETARGSEEERRFKRTSSEEIEEKQGKGRQERRSVRAAAEKRREEKKPADKKSAEEHPSTAKQKKPVEISPEDTKVAAKIIADIRADNKIVLTPEQFDAFRRILVQAGWDIKQVNEMSVADVIVASQAVLQNAEVVGGSGEKPDSLTKELISKAQSRDEEELTADKVEKNIMHPISGGAMEHEEGGGGGGETAA